MAKKTLSVIYISCYECEKDTYPDTKCEDCYKWKKYNR
jgi:hypothetical protein